MRKLFMTRVHVLPILLTGVGITLACFEVCVYLDGCVLGLILYFVRGLCRNYGLVLDFVRLSGAL